MSRKIWFLTVVFFLLPLCACAPILGPSQERATVTRVIDGDTIVIDTGQKVRYIGIDTPEIYPEREACGMEAWGANRELVEGKEIILERDVSETDKYGRLLRYVYADNIFVNGELVRRGLAEARAYPPDTKHQEYMEGLEAVARETGRGIWAK
ncbi:thermonuclease family protein [Chloroflexota bacterium]